MRLPIKQLSKEELISSLLAILLPLWIIMFSTLYIIGKIGGDDNQRSIENRVMLFAGYASLLIHNAGSEKEIISLIKGYKNALGIKEIAVILEDSQGDLAFLKKKRYLVFPGSEHEGKILSSERKRDKLIFDLISRIDTKSGIATTKDEFEIHIVRRVEKGSLPLYVYISERLFSSSDLPLPLVNTLIASLLSIVIFFIGLLFFYNFRHAFGLISIVAFVLYSLSGRELIKRWNAATVRDQVTEISLLLDFNTQKRLSIPADRIYEIAPLKVISKAAPSETISQSSLPLSSQILQSYKQQDSRYSYFLPISKRPFEAIRMNIPIKNIIENGIGKYYLTLLFSTIIGLLIYIFYAVGYVEIFVSNLIAYFYAYRYISPAVLSTVVLIFIPFIAGIGLSLFEHNHGIYTFVGLENYIKILSAQGRRLLEPLSFYYTLMVTILWTATNLAIHVSVGLILALILKNPLLRLKEIYRVLLILPWAIPNYITALIWKGMFHKQFGVINELIGYFGIEEVSWFSSFTTAFAANLITNSWLGFPFMMVISLGALQSIPQEIYEAADIEGASRWEKFRKITLPLLKPALFPAIILGSIWTFNMFNIIYLVSGGEPSGATDILIVEAYRWAFERGERYGYAAAYSTIIFLILLGYSLVTNRYSKATENIY